MFDPKQVYFETNPIADCLAYYCVPYDCWPADLYVGYEQTVRIYIKEGPVLCTLSCYRLKSGRYELTHYRCN